MALETIDIYHSHVHNGKIFSYSDINTSVGSGAMITHLFQTGYKAVHIRPAVSSSSMFTATLKEGCATTYLGTKMTAYNRNRLYADKPLSLIGDTPSYSDGTTIYTQRFGAPSQGNSISPSFVFGEFEWIYAPNTNYIFEITNNDSSASTISLNFLFYEV